MEITLIMVGYLEQESEHSSTHSSNDDTEVTSRVPDAALYKKMSTLSWMENSLWESNGQINFWGFFYQFLCTQ